MAQLVNVTMLNYTQIIQVFLTPEKVKTNYFIKKVMKRCQLNNERK